MLREILKAFGRPEDDFDWVRDRPGHDRRYAIDSARLRRELGWRPARTDFAAGPCRHRRVVPRQRGLVAPREGRHQGKVPRPGAVGGLPGGRHGTLNCSQREPLARIRDGDVRKR